MKYVQPQNVFSVRKKERRVRIIILFILVGLVGLRGSVAACSRGRNSAYKRGGDARRLA